MLKIECCLLPLVVHRVLCPLAVIIQETLLLFLYSDLPVSLSACKFCFQHLFYLLLLCFQFGPMCQGIVTEGKQWGLFSLGGALLTYRLLCTNIWLLCTGKLKQNKPETKQTENKTKEELSIAPLPPL